MRLHEAIEKAGPGGKGKCGRYSFTRCECEREGNVKFYFDDEHLWILPSALSLSDQWEVVEDNPVIKVGDTVMHCKGHECKVIERYGYVLALYRPSHLDTQPCACKVSIFAEQRDLTTLIRKGPKVIDCGVHTAYDFAGPDCGIEITDLPPGRYNIIATERPD